MKKFIVYLSSFALAGSVAYAMNEAVDEEMMMEAPSPSVTVGGSAAIGIINDDDDDDATEDFKLIREYKVTFASSGVTDGGLMFGAGFAIEDTHDDDPHQAVKSSSVYVGGTDGSWKLQFGGNDQGIDLAGGFGVADEHFGGGNNVDIALSGSFDGTSYRITVADPGLPATDDGDNDWSIGVSQSVSTINVGVGMDSEDGLAIGVGSDLSGVSTFVYWSKSEHNKVTVKNINGQNDALGDASQEWTGLGVKASMTAGEGATFSVGYSTLKNEQDYSLFTGASVNGDGTAKTKLIEVDFSYELGGGAALSAGIDKKEAEVVQVGTSGSVISQTETTTLEAKITMSF